MVVSCVDSCWLKQPFTYQAAVDAVNICGSSDSALHRLTAESSCPCSHTCCPDSGGGGGDGGVEEEVEVEVEVWCVFPLYALCCKH